MKAGRTAAPWVLVTDGAPDHGQSRTTLWTVRALARAGYRPAVTVSAPHSLAARSRYTARTIDVPPIHHDGAAFADAVRSELERHRYLTVLPTSDPALIALGYDVEHLLDKGLLGASAERAGIPTPPTERVAGPSELGAAAERVGYPVIVKPTMGHGAGLATGPAELDRWAGDRGPLLVQTYVEGGLHAIAGVVWGGRIVAAVHQRFLRTWPTDAGMTCAAETIEADPDREAALLRLLEGYTGIFQADFAGPYLLDLNPRSFASLSLAMEAGANLVAIYCDLLMGQPVQDVRARPGVFYRWLDADIRHAVTGVRAGRMSLGHAARILRPRRHTARGGPESITDPGPLLARAAYLASTIRRRRSERSPRGEAVPR
jgi:predicted ATP-grasp superfamily ATP-dependent carboligase